jgi:site-specific recombinase XerD
MLSNYAYYQSILENAFDTFLTNQGVSQKTKTNYKSDLNHFLGWFAGILDKSFAKLDTKVNSFLNPITPQLLTEYRDSLTLALVPAATINRRLSTLRMFFRCTIENKWMNSNPTDGLQNIQKETTPELTQEDLLTKFEAALASEGAAQTTVKNYSSDVSQFLNWIALTR